MVESAWPQDPGTLELKFKPRVFQATATGQMTNISAPATLVTNTCSDCLFSKEKAVQAHKHPPTGINSPQKQTVIMGVFKMSCLPSRTGDWGTGHLWQSLSACYVLCMASESKESKKERKERKGKSGVVLDSGGRGRRVMNLGSA